MAKLYVEVESDRAQKHQIANKYLKIKVFYGSREHSIEALTLLVEATSDEPRVTVFDQVSEKNVETERMEIVTV
jgi:hypothetical protein